jgi:hypothetical protein
MDKDNRKMDIGAVIRDVEGEVLATLLALKDFITDPLLSKSLQLVMQLYFVGSWAIKRWSWKEMLSKWCKPCGRKIVT